MQPSGESPARLLNLAVAGAGFSGAVIARELALAGHRVDVFEARAHVAGNCHTARDAETGVMVHVYGPHIFHTSNVTVWRYVQQFDEFVPFTNRVKAVTGGRVYSLPVNLLTINQFFGTTLSPAAAEAYVAARADHRIRDPRTFEEQALRFLGKELYEAFFRGYTLKQWGVAPDCLPASILKRLPLRFNYDDNYYDSTWQGIPRHGYTHLVERMLDHPNITVTLNHPFHAAARASFNHVFHTGPLDAWFDFNLGPLGYRTLDFASEYHEGDFQGTAVINYCDASVPWTRITEHKHLAPWETHSRTLIYREFSRACAAGDLPFYPLRLVHDKSLLASYVNQARREAGVTFAGRLGTYRYLDMHVAIAEALEVAHTFLRQRQDGAAMPVFLHNPL